MKIKVTPKMHYDKDRLTMVAEFTAYGAVTLASASQIAMADNAVDVFHRAADDAARMLLDFLRQSLDEPIEIEVKAADGPLPR